MFGSNILLVTLAISKDTFKCRFLELHQLFLTYTLTHMFCLVSILHLKDHAFILTLYIIVC